MAWGAAFRSRLGRTGPLLINVSMRAGVPRRMMRDDAIELEKFPEATTSSPNCGAAAKPTRERASTHYLNFKLWQPFLKINRG
jgi:hypothetical protein